MVRPLSNLLSIETNKGDKRRRGWISEPYRSLDAVTQRRHWCYLMKNEQIRTSHPGTSFMISRSRARAASFRRYASRSCSARRTGTRLILDQAVSRLSSLCWLTENHHRVAGRDEEIRCWKNRVRQERSQNCQRYFRTYDGVWRGVRLLQGDHHGTQRR